MTKQTNWHSVPNSPKISALMQRKVISFQHSTIYMRYTYDIFCSLHGRTLIDMFFVSASVCGMEWEGLGEWPCTYLLQVAARFGTINLSSKGRTGENAGGEGDGQGDKNEFYLLF